ncbi:MAG: hypothetical protein ACOC54_03125 [Candidatus Sumerlaeota bacterium]
MLLVGLILIITTGTACRHSRIHRLDGTDYPPKASDAPIDTYDTRLDRPYEAVAILDSIRMDNFTPENQLRMRENLKEMARELGADAVHDIRSLEVKKRGAVSDEVVPIPGAWRQARYKRYFLRGEAVRYLPETDKQ